MNAAKGSPTPAIGLPLGMLAELTHRCPLQCPYCSNPQKLLKASTELDTATWQRVFEEAADLGVLQVHLSGGEPTLRRDLPQIIRTLNARGIYTNLITAGVSLDAAGLEGLVAAGLDHVQVSIQGADARVTELIGNFKGGFEKKCETARTMRRLGIPLTINAPIHRHNIAQVDAFIDLALELDADRLEIANVQYYGWAYINRSMLMPDRDAVERQVETVTRAREALRGVLTIDFVTPDYYADYPKPCMGGWGADALVITPEGKVLPCHASETIPHLEFDFVTEKSLAEIWTGSSAFNAYRGTAWMPEPCQSCPRKELDFGGCRCQAFALTGNAAATDPACILSAHHAKMAELAAESIGRPQTEFVYRRIS
ncbi:MAG: pyrroloquinoline quinone biosynthesis protein PqqE [Rhizobiales bacterium]|nr:pyrroloquinoline quinone biosynthesis protein PqqE [Hyphomicrobiales bacterium]